MTFRKRHGFFYILVIGIILLLYWCCIYRGISPGNRTPDILSGIVQNTIIAGLTAVSIVLPLTVGILGYAVKENINCISLLFWACIFFLVSACASLWNLFRLPGLVTNINIANDFKTAVFQIIQLYSLLYGFIYLIIGAWKITQAAINKTGSS